MGYSTDFDGSINVEPALTEEQVALFNKNCNERHDGAGYPGIWCDLEVNEEGDSIQWNGSEKTYALPEWFAYLIKDFFQPAGLTLNGTMDAAGEEVDDRWQLRIVDNKVTTIALVAVPQGDEVEY